MNKPEHVADAIRRIREAQADGKPTVELFMAGAVPLADEVERLRRYERAIASMAAQICCPKTSPEQMVAEILGEVVESRGKKR